MENNEQDTILKPEHHPAMNEFNSGSSPARINF